MRPDAFPVIDISSWDVVGTESAGLTAHEWVRAPEPGRAQSDRLWLFKPATRRDDHRQGEDWVEKVAFELGTVLGLPCARIELCEKAATPGCLSEDLRPSRWEMQPGSVAMSELVQDYESRTKARTGHNLTNVRRALQNVSAPPLFTGPRSLSAFDVFAGYLVFDALIANRDRHDENWSILRPPPGELNGDCLSGSYDHASALGFSLTDAHRARILRAGGVESWACKGTAYKFEHASPGPIRSLVDLSHEALLLASGACAPHWLTKVEALTDEVVFQVLAAVPGLSNETIEFTAQLVAINRRRILDESPI